MAEEKLTSFIGKIKGQVIKGNILSDKDVAKIKEYHGKVDTNAGEITKLKQKVDAINKYDKKIALKDYYTQDLLGEMETNTIYMVAFKNSKFVAPNESGAQFWPEGQQPDYFELVRKDSAGAKQKLGREQYTATMDNYLSKTADNEFTGFMRRIIEDSKVGDGDSVAYMTKFKDLDAAGEGPFAKQIYSGHLALDKNGKKLYAHTGTVGKDGNRQASLGVYKADGNPAGEVCLKTTKDGSKVTLTIPPLGDAPTDNEAATVKFVKEEINKKQHVEFKYQATAPSGDAITENTIFFYDATELLK